MLLKKSPNNARGYNNLGYAFATAGRIADAKKAYTTALSIRPDYALARANLAGISTLNLGISETINPYTDSLNREQIK